MKLCKDCKHFTGSIRDGECQHPGNFTSTTDPVTGKVSTEVHWYGASFQRQDGYFTSLISRTCGKPGRWWSAITKEAL